MFLLQCWMCPSIPLFLRSWFKPTWYLLDRCSIGFQLQGQDCVWNLLPPLHVQPNYSAMSREARGNVSRTDVCFLRDTGNGVFLLNTRRCLTCNVPRPRERTWYPTDLVYHRALHIKQHLLYSTCHWSISSKYHTGISTCSWDVGSSMTQGPVLQQVW